MNPALRPLLSRSLLLLTVLALGAGCDPVDPDEGLQGLTTRCVHQDSCAPGFQCEPGRGVCVRQAGEVCREGFENQLCDKTEGVCAGARRACVDGVVAASCAAESYGSDYEALETRCDGLDNDCDGSTDMALGELVLSGVDASPGNPVQARLVPFGDALLAVSANAVNVGTLEQPSYQTTLRFEPLTIDRRPMPGAQAQVVHEAVGTVDDLQVLPFRGGAFIQWRGSKQVSSGDGQTYSVYTTQVARIDVGESAARPVVGIAPRDMPNPYGAYQVRAAVSGDSQHLLVAWAMGTVRGQRFSLALEPAGAEATLSAPFAGDPPSTGVSRVEVAAHGAADFVVAWQFAAPYNGGSSPPTEPNRLRFRRVSGALAPLGEVVGLDAEVGYLADLQLLGSARPEVQPFAAWVVSAPYVPGRPALVTLRYAQPFGAGSPASEPLEVSAVTSSVGVGRDGSDQPLMILLRDGRDGVMPTVRRVDDGFAAQDRPVGMRLGDSYHSVSFVPGPVPERWGVTFMAQNWQRIGNTNSWAQASASLSATGCRF